MALNSALKEGLGVWSRQAAHLGLICLLDAEVSNCAKLAADPAPTALPSSSSSWEAGALGSFRHSHLQELHCHVFHPVPVLIFGWCPSRAFSLGGSEGRWEGGLCRGSAAGWPPF